MPPFTASPPDGNNISHPFRRAKDGIPSSVLVSATSKAWAMLLQAIDHVEIGQHAESGVGVGFSVGAEPDIYDALHAGGIGGSDFLPGLALAGGEVCACDLEGNATGQYQQAFAVGREAEGDLVGG